MSGAVSPEEIAAAFRVAAQLHQAGRIDEAAAGYERLLAAAPNHAQALRLLGICHFQSGRLEAGVPLLERALALKSDAQTHADLAKALRALRRFEAALPHYEAALAAQANDPVLLADAADAHLAVKRHAAAAALYERARAAGQPSAELHFKLALARQSLAEHEAAAEHYARALELKPDDAEAHHNLGVALAALKRHAKAIEHYRQAIALKPDTARFHANLAFAIRNLGRHDEAAAEYGRAVALDPTLDCLLGAWIHAKMMTCGWDGLAEGIEMMAEGIARGENVATPFPVIATPLSGETERRCAEIYVENNYPRTAPPVWPAARRDGPIRIAYVSGDLHDHPVGYLIADMLELHDRARFEVTALSFGPERGGAMRERLKAGFDRFLDIRGLPDDEALRLARALDLDIAVDLMGHTGEARTGLFAAGLAPLQVNFLGYPGTMGAPYMDYLIADPVVAPAERRALYVEKIASLPHSFQPNDRARPVSDRTFTRAEFGLPENGVVFCCFNKNYKITPQLFDVWMRLLSRLPGSVLWLFEDTPAVARNLRREAEMRGVDPTRIVFARKMHSLADYLARAKCADLFLDTLHYNAHTTAADALWAGVPVLTCPGETFASRVAASLVTSVGLPEMIAKDLADYEEIAFALAAQPAKLAALRAKLAANLPACPLFDTPRYTRHLEATYEEMVRRRSAGLPPDHFSVPALPDACG